MVDICALCGYLQHHLRLVWEITMPGEEFSLHTCTILYLFGFMQFGLFRSLSPAKLTLDQETGGFHSDS
jgi:hypothetical protein